MIATNSDVKQKAKCSALNSVRAGVLQRKCACGGTPGPTGECEACRRKRLERKTNNFAIEAQNNSVAPRIVQQVLSSPGQPLDRETRAFFEPRFGHDFTNVRVHADARASESARAVSAQAYTVGPHIVFNRQEYTPGTNRGRHLLAHELAHVVQQSGAVVGNGQLRIGEVNSSAEREADEAARTHSSESRIKNLTPAGRLGLQRKWDWGRAGWGALIGGGIGAIVGGLAAIALGPAALLLGVGAGLVAGGLIGGFTGKDEKKPQPKPPVIPPAPGCSATQDGMIGSGLKVGLTMLDTTIGALNGLNPKAPGNDRAKRAAAALMRYFKSDDTRIANHLVQRFTQIKDFMSRLIGKRAAPLPVKQPPDPDFVAPTECHTAEMDEDCGRGIAYVPSVRPGQAEREGMVFCPRFFQDNAAKNDQERGGIIVHEAAHSVAGGERIIDRGYSDLRFFPDLTTEEALTNADSYRVFILHVTGDSEPSIGHTFIDDVEECGADQPKVDQSFRKIQKWLSIAGVVVHDRRPKWQQLDYWVNIRRNYLGGDGQDLVDAAAKAYDRVGGMLGLFVSARCHRSADQTCPAGTATASVPGGFGPEIQLCPDWLNEKDADRQALLVFAEMLAGAGIADPKSRMNHAEMARQLFQDLGQAPSLEKILTPFEQKPASAPSQPTSAAAPPP